LKEICIGIVIDAGFLACKPALTPIDNHTKLSSTESVPFKTTSEWF